MPSQQIRGMVTQFPHDNKANDTMQNNVTIGDKMEKLETIFVDEIPEKCEEGKLYISEKFGISIHLCPCGCGHKSVLNFKPEWSNGWDMTKNGDIVTFRPSVGNFGMPCKSHYFITENRIEWC